MTTDPLNNPPAPVLPAPVPTPTPTPTRTRATKTVCQFCKCELTADGDFFTMSDEAKALRDAKDENVKLQERIRVLEGEVQALRVVPKNDRNAAYPFR